MKNNQKKRKEIDSMGEMGVPEDALYGAQTQRAVINFPISNLKFSRSFIAALGVIKWSAAKTNLALGLLSKEKASAIMAAAEEIINGNLDSHFVVDIFQSGSATSTNMNANEVISNRAIQLSGGKLGDKFSIHPNDEVNMSQSSNDVIPGAIHIAAYQAIKENLLPSLAILARELEKKSVEFSNVIKAARTHLQDATPINLGQEFGGYAAQIAFGMERINKSIVGLRELALGGTAVGTGINAHPEFAEKMIKTINAKTGFDFIEARNHFEAQSARDAVVEVSGSLRTLACSIIKICNDLRWLSSGPRCGLSEIELPATQPGSSIMPAKVNPVICESTLMVAMHVIGNDACIATCGQNGNFELNTMLPVIAHNFLEAIELLANATKNLRDKCICGIKANVNRCRGYAENSIALVTALAPKIGYDKAAEIAKKALSENKSIRAITEEMKILPEAELANLLDLAAMTKN